MTFLLFNAGVPMIFPSLHLMVLALLPIIILEALYLYVSLNISFSDALKNMGIGNVVSTFIGIPITWLLLVIMTYLTGGGSIYQINTPLKKLAVVVVQSAWLAPYGRNLRWMIPAAGLVLLIPFFFVSWFFEYWVVSYLLENIELIASNQAVRNANLLSYALLGGYLLIRLLKESHQLSKAISNKSLKTRRKKRLKNAPLRNNQSVS
jgi:hypothetical protein